MAKKKAAARKIKSAHKRGKSIRGKTKAPRTRRSAVKKQQNRGHYSDNQMGGKADPAGPKVNSSRAAHTAGKLVSAISRAKTHKEIAGLKKKLKGLGASNRNKDWEKQAVKAGKKRAGQLRGNKKRRQKPKAGSKGVGSSRRRGGGRKRSGSSHFSSFRMGG